MDANAYADRYPEARVVCPAGAMDAVRKEVKRIDASLEDEMQGLEFCRLLRPPGVSMEFQEIELALSLKDAGASNALVIGDLFFNVTELPPSSGCISKIISQWYFGSIGPLGVTKYGRRCFLKDPEALASWVEEKLCTGTVTIIAVAHGHLIEGQSTCDGELRACAKRIQEGR
jgi:hypothetical protein